MLWSPALFALSTAFAAAVPDAPSPQPSTLPEIGHVRSSSVCGSLASLVRPVADVVKRNDIAFASLRSAGEKFANGTVSETMPVVAKDPLGALDLDESGDDQSQYTPERTIAASNMDRNAGEILTNLDGAGRVLHDSYQAHPAHADPAYDAVRQRLQNLVDLQRVLAFRLSDAAGAYQSNHAGKGFIQESEVASFEAALAAVIAPPDVQEAADAQGLATIDGPIPDDTSKLKSAPVPDVAKAIRVQKLALTLQVQRLAATCSAMSATPPPAELKSPAP